ncbi:MAG: S8 family serine peptidase [Myxococcota bacterium]
MRRLPFFVVLLVLAPGALAAPPDPATVRANMRAAVQAVAAEKASRTPAERKIASQLLYASRARRGQAAIPGISTLRSQVAWERDGTTLVDLRATVSGDLLAAIEALGGTVVNAYPRYDAVRARLPEPAIDALAARADVRNLRPADRYVLRKDNTSEGDVAHRADDLRLAEGVDGSGVTVGVMSDGVDTLAARQATGDLPGTVTVLPGAAGAGDEGTAMLEIVHDLAPGASLLFATALGGEAAFATNIGALVTAGADIIVDDIGYFAEGVFQDNAISAAIDAAAAAGVLYFAAAGNDGAENAGTSGVWEGDWLDSGTTNEGNPLHDWNGLGVWDNFIQADSDVFILKWSDELGASANDYDLLLFDPMGTLVGSSINIQDGDDDPIESIGSDPFDDTGNRLVVARFTGADRMLHLHTFGGNLEFSTPGAIYGHPGARGAVAAAAVDYFFAGGPGGEFDGSESVEAFSSDGPRRVHYEADGTPITPGNFSSSGGELRSKPDIAGADGVTVAAPGFTPFFGTSAAAPHLAALAALLMEFNPAATAADVRSAMEGSALDIEAVGDDRDSGHGIVEAVAAATLLPEPGPAALLWGTGLLGTLARRRSRRPRRGA